MNTQEKEMNVFQSLIKHEPHYLDRPLADLLPLRFMGEVAVHAYQGLIKRLDDLPLSLEEKKSRLKDGQDAGKALLMIEARIGELYSQAPEAPRPGRLALSPGRTKKEIAPKSDFAARAKMKKAATIYHHPAEVQEVIREAEENEDIPTKTAVLNKIAYKRERERNINHRDKTQLEMAADAYGYYIKLQEALTIIPPKPPKEIRDRDLTRIKALALLIIKRLEVFTDGTKSKVLPESVRGLSA